MVQVNACGQRHAIDRRAAQKNPSGPMQGPLPIELCCINMCPSIQVLGCWLEWVVHFGCREPATNDIFDTGSSGLQDSDFARPIREAFDAGNLEILEVIAK